MKRMHLRGAVAAVVLGICALGVGTSGPAAAPDAAAQSTVSPQAALDWNLIAVNTVRAATPAKFQIEGALYMTYVQAAVYDAVAAIRGSDGKGKDRPTASSGSRSRERPRGPRSRRRRTRRSSTTSRPRPRR